ncbi:MAG: hypothetical protein ACRDGV_08090 [Candidatus Limnocylindria bacterium]
MDDRSPRERELEERIAALERRLARGEDATDGPATAFWALMHRIFPEDARRHMKSATREQLLTARTYLDRWIANLEESGEQKAPPPHEKIAVE